MEGLLESLSDEANAEDLKAHFKVRKPSSLPMQMDPSLCTRKYKRSCLLPDLHQNADEISKKATKFKKLYAKRRTHVYDSKNLPDSVKEQLLGVKRMGKAYLSHGDHFDGISKMCIGLMEAGGEEVLPEVHFKIETRTTLPESKATAMANQMVGCILGHYIHAHAHSRAHARPHTHTQTRARARMCAYV